MKKEKKELDEKERKALVARIESALVRGAENYFRKEGFVWVPSVPHIVSITGACENVDTLFPIEYFGREAYLTQTGQTALEEMTTNLERVCTIIHSFRKEDVVDNRHLTEFPLIEFEFRYDPNKEDGFELLLSHIENTIYSMIENVLETESVTLDKIGVDTYKIEKLRTPFERISYDEAVKLLEINWGEDLTSIHEARLVGLKGDNPLFVTRYPETIKFFNMQLNRNQPSIVNSADLLLPPGGESVGSAVRENDYKTLVNRLDKSEMMKNLRRRGKDIKDFEGYLKVVRNDPVPHAGCGIGLNRVTQYMLKEIDIKKATPYPMNKEIMY